MGGIGFIPNVSSNAFGEWRKNQERILATKRWLNQREATFSRLVVEKREADEIATVESLARASRIRKILLRMEDKIHQKRYMCQ